MKTLVKPLFFAFALSFGSLSATSAATSQPLPTSSVRSYQSSLYTDAQGKLRVAVDKLVGGVVEVRLVNSRGHEFFVQRVGKRQKTARIMMDISTLPDGAYQVVITDGFHARVNHLTLTTQQPLPSFSGRLIALN
ncbi:hypothetical protein [Larkinella rosea]|uniref:Secretion system C-terminal sorting domain-containing protein n=1 Tax=Larkinella rosea TaxID=2025312 RepID=A0A3P1BJ52_9BACT|nr:hypothetical protein [Larkinella rosea]RRB01121.1 hypothetical protein EHT25_23390 [Larkinella rosea]